MTPSSWDYEVAARTIFGEARGEPTDGQRAVAHVIVNRLKMRIYGDTLAQVCLFAHQFSCWSTATFNIANLHSMAGEPFDSEYLVDFRGYITDAVAGIGDDPTAGAQFYYEKDIPRPAWAKDFKLTATIGKHLFFCDPHALNAAVAG